jgi:hypothetical protein
VDKKKKEEDEVEVFDLHHILKVHLFVFINAHY